MPAYLDTKRSFADVSVTDAGVNTVEFAEAVDGLIGLFDLLNSSAFTPVVSDLKGNIAKVRTRHTSHPAESTTLEEMVKNEFEGGKKRPASEGLMWLLRGLDFTAQALTNAQKEPTQELSAAFTTSYENTLKKFHNFVVKGIFSVAMKACPYRKDLYDKLKADQTGAGAPISDEHLNTQLNAYLHSLNQIVARLQAFYEKGGYNKGF